MVRRNEETACGPRRQRPDGPVLTGSAAWLILLLDVASCVPAPGPAEPVLAIEDVTVVDVEAGRVSGHRTVLVHGDRIVAVGATGSVPVPPSAPTIDGSGRYLIPGLWDMHVHALFDADLADGLLALLVANGVTGIRDMGGRLEVLSAVRRRVREGDLLAPRIVAAGPILDGPGAPHPEISWIVETPEEAVRAVDSLMAADVDFLKVYTMLPRDAFLEIAALAEERGVPVAGHVPGSVSPVEAARAGMASMEHLRSEIEPFCTMANPEACRAPFRAFAEYVVWQTPTLVVRRNRAFLNDSTVVMGRAMAYAPAALQSEWQAIRESRMERGLDYFEDARERHRDERWLTRTRSARSRPESGPTWCCSMAIR